MEDEKRNEGFEFFARTTKTGNSMIVSIPKNIVDAFNIGLNDMLKLNGVVHKKAEQLKEEKESQPTEEKKEE